MTDRVRMAIFGLLSVAICVALYFGIPFACSTIAENYIKDKIASDYHNVAKLMDLNSKNLVDDLLKKIDTLPLNLAEENQKLREENKKWKDTHEQKQKNISGMLTR